MELYYICIQRDRNNDTSKSGNRIRRLIKRESRIFRQLIISETLGIINDILH